jgi:hypothetical protein
MRAYSGKISRLYEGAMGALREFTAELMDEKGAVVEAIEPDDLHVLAPEPVRALMGWPELARLGFGPKPSPGAMAVGLEGDWLDRFDALLGEQGRFAERQLVLPSEVAPPSDPERLIGRAAELPNAIWRLRGATATWTRCLLLAFRYRAISDEQRAGLVWVGFNCATGAALDAAIVQRLRTLLEGDAQWRAPEPDARRAAAAPFDAAALIARARSVTEHLARQDLEHFMRAMRRRLERDRDRIHGYHDDLRRTALTKAAALRSAQGDKAEAGRQREAARIAAIEREYVAKLEDLRHKYALRVTVSWVQGLAVVAPVHRYDVLIKRRKGERSLALDWHAAARMFEPLPCDWGVGLERVRLVCDDRLHLTEPSGQAPCPSCAKPWCRACEPAGCPRCLRIAAAAAKAPVAHAK